MAALEIASCAVLAYLGIALCAYGFMRQGDPRRLGFVLSSVSMVMAGAVIASCALTYAILLIRAAI